MGGLKNAGALHESIKLESLSGDGPQGLIFFKNFLSAKIDNTAVRA